MAYTDFTLESIEAELGIRQRVGPLFDGLVDLEPPSWLTGQLARGMSLALVSEKSRSEFIVAPILLAVRERSGGRVSILSGQRLDVDLARRLVGECDFLLSRAEPLPRLQAPLLAILEAKKNDIDAGLGQCAAQLVGARTYNDRAGVAPTPLHGCVTTGETWQFLRLVDDELTIDPSRRFIDRVGSILAALVAAVGVGDPGGPPGLDSARG